jgi:solute carrier family 35 protein C2
MVKSSTLIFVLIFAFIFRLEAVTVRLVLVVLFIFAGVFLSVAAETTIVVPGLILILVASACAGLRWSLTQVLLKKSPKMGMNHPAATLFWLTPAMGVTLAIMSMVLDGWGNVFRLPFFEPDRILKTIVIFIFPGCLAFCMVLSEY